MQNLYGALIRVSPYAPRAHNHTMGWTCYVCKSTKNQHTPDICKKCARNELNCELDKVKMLLAYKERQVSGLTAEAARLQEELEALSWTVVESCKSVPSTSTSECHDVPGL